MRWRTSDPRSARRCARAMRAARRSRISRSTEGLTVTPVADASVGHRRATLHPLRVMAVEPLTDDAVVIEFEIPPELEGEYAFTHGQHVSLRCEAAGDDVRRSYSICSAAGTGRLRVAVKRL